MRMINTLNTTARGLVEHYPPSSMEIPFQTRIRCTYFNTHFLMVDVPPWGTVLPFTEEMNEVVRYFFEVDTLYMPKDTVLDIRWTPRSGNNMHTISHLLPGDGLVSTAIQVPTEWLSETQGENVLVEFEVTYPDGSIESGRHFDVRVPRSLEYGAVIIAGLQNGELFNPDRYPDGVTSRIDPIINAEEYCTIRFFWEALAYSGDSKFLLADWSTAIPCVPGKAYEFVVPPEAYSGLNVPQFDRIEIVAHSFVKLAPEPTPQFNYSFSRLVFPVAFDRK